MTDSPENPHATAEAEWLVFACTWCQHPLKVRADQTGGTFRCPSCEHEVTAPRAVGEATSERSSLPEAPTAGHSPVFSGELAVDRLSTAQFRSIDDPALAIPEEGIRVRKRKRRPHNPNQPGANTPEWEANPDADPATPQPDATGEWEDLTSTTLKQEVREDGSVIEHRKRTKRKRLPPFVEKAWGVLTRVASFSLLALGLLVLVGAAVAGWYLARSQAPVVAQAEQQPEIPDRFFPTMDEGAAAAEVVKAFLAADTVEKKLPLVRFPEKVKPLMDLWYKGRPDKSIKATRDELAETLTKFLHIDGTKFVVVTLLTEPDDEYKIFAVESSPYDGLRVDWETAVGWQAMTVEEFIKGKPTTPQPFRVQAAPGDYYNGAYSDESKWCAVNLTYPGNPDFNLYGYVERNTPTGDRLMRLLGYHQTRTSDGKTEWEQVQAQSSALILAIAYLREGSDPKQVTIHDVLHEQWFLRDGPAVGNARKTEANQ
jgi:hypothetical protein